MGVLLEEAVLVKGTLFGGGENRPGGEEVSGPT